MPQCELTGKKPVPKNLVSHSNIKTKSIANPNIQKKRVFSSLLNKHFSLKIATTTLKTMESKGGLDTFLLNQSDEFLSKRALKVKSQIKNKIKDRKNKNSNENKIK